MERRAIKVEGIVQGVGFRPFVQRLATRHGLTGSVENRCGHVAVEVQGPIAALDAFERDLVEDAPGFARIERVDVTSQSARSESGFRIARSRTGGGETNLIPADVATCEACRAELFDPANRRYRYPFINCTACGPRLTIVTGAPYDRVRTTMAEFPLCSACRAEYENPADRRFHAEPIACPACGPQLVLTDSQSRERIAGDALQEFAFRLRQGAVGAVKGLGGFHLVCDAQSDVAVNALRRKKRRDEKPFAVMVATLEEASRFCELTDVERSLLNSPGRPIVLLRKRPETSQPTPPPLADGIAPGNPFLGVLLPYTPLHELLLREFDGPLVMTSGNRSNEPIVFRDADAAERLAGIADVILGHDRRIHTRCEDSVVRVVAERPVPVRRSRGDAPLPIRLPFPCRTPTLAVGGQLKSVFGLAKGTQAILSHHLGDLDDFESSQAFERDVSRYEDLFAIVPQRIAHDRHPDYASTRYAVRRAGAESLATIPVGHHRAHMASVMAEHGLKSPVIGVIFDGAGYGDDGSAWGGEFLVGDYRSSRRAAHLHEVAMPGGDRAAREPWRMAISWMRTAGCDFREWRSSRPPETLQTVEKMLERRVNSPMTSSMGRLFDAVAALVGLRDRIGYEGQAAMELEWLAMKSDVAGAYDFEMAASSPSTDAPLVLDPRPMIRQIVEAIRTGDEARSVARRFHNTLVEMVAEVCRVIRLATSVNQVALGGGVFLNGLLTAATDERLRRDDFEVFRNRQVPPGDGGLALGQLAIAAAWDETSRTAMPARKSD